MQVVRSEPPEMTRLRMLHRVLGALCLALIVLMVVANVIVHTAPGGLGYFKRGDVASYLVLALFLAATLFWASAGDTDGHRTTGSVGAGMMTGLLLSTVSIPVVAVPLAVIGWFRLPESRTQRVALVVLVPLALAIGVAVPYAARPLAIP